MKYMCRAIKYQMDGQLKMMPCPFSSSLLDGPLDKGKDLIAGGCWYTVYGLFLVGLANAADSLCGIDKLIFRDKKVSWEQLLEALKDNWTGHDDLRELFINGAPKYGNDDDYADSFAAFVVDAYADAIDWANQQKDLIPEVGGEYRGGVIVGNGPVGLGAMTGALPCGHINPYPLADTMSPIQGYDKRGPTAVVKSVSKVPQHRLTLGCTLNQRLSPQVVATDEDMDRFVAFMRSFEELGVYHIQFNVVSSDLLRKAMKEPDSYRDLLIRVASYVAYFVELDTKTQLDIIARTEQQTWTA
jgi:formate C-acetyltransferase